MKAKKILSLIMASVLALSVAGCGDVRIDKEQVLSPEDAKTEMGSLLKKVSVSTVEDPQEDYFAGAEDPAQALADISTFPIVLHGTGTVDAEIAVATEMSSDAPDDWIIKVAEKFNKQATLSDGTKASVSIRKMASGEAVTYMDAGIYKPQGFIPSNDAWGKMLSASGIETNKVTDRIAGNTAGFLMKKDVYDTFISKYKKATVKNVLTAANAGDITFAYTNPYTSSTGLNILTAMLKSFDESNPLSDKASEALLKYQKNSPPVAYTTAVLRNSAKKGVINAMVMEEQAYVNTPELKDYVYTPAGIRHDHPVYTFGWSTDKENEVVKLFAEFCQKEENQNLAKERGFNRHDDYKSEDSGLDGAGYLAAQKLWKENKSGGKPIIAVFVADISGSMSGEPINSLKESLINAMSYIGEDHYVGLVSFASDVTVNLPIEKFDDLQRARFAGEVENLNAVGGTATYDATLVATDMIRKKMQEIPDAKPMLFVLTDGDQNEGFSLHRITGIIGGFQIPVYSIAYNYSNTGDLEKLSGINEAAVIKADSDDIANQIRNLFNVQL